MKLCSLPWKSESEIGSKFVEKFTDRGELSKCHFATSRGVSGTGARSRG